MSTFLHLTTVCLLTLGCQAAALSQEIPWQNDPAAAMQQSASSRKPVLMLFSAKWCRPCQDLERFVLSDKRVASTTAESTIPVRIDADQSPDLMTAYQVTQLPTVVFVDAQGRPFARHSSQDTNRFEPMAWLEMVSQAGRTHDVILKDGSDTLSQMDALQKRWEENRAAANPAQTEEFTIPPFSMQPSFNRDAAGQAATASQANAAVSIAAGQPAPSAIETPASPQTGLARQKPDHLLEPSRLGEAPPVPRSFEAPPVKPAVSLSNQEASATHEPAAIAFSLPAAQSAPAGKTNPESIASSDNSGIVLPGESAAFRILTPQPDPSAPKEMYTSSKPDSGSAASDQPTGSDPSVTQEPAVRKAEPATIRNQFLVDSSPQAPAVVTPHSLAAPQVGQAGMAAQAAAGPSGFAVHSTGNSPQSPAVSHRSETPAPSSTGAASADPLCLDGYCPVTLLQDMAWVPGNPAIGCIHRGRTYLFASEKQRDVFLATPDQWSPVLAGFDPVRFHKHGELVAGKRELGMFMTSDIPGGAAPTQVVLFASAESKAEFEQRPEPFMESVSAAVAQADAGSVKR